MLQRKKFITRKQFHKMLNLAFENDLFLVEFKDNTSKMVNGRDFLKLDTREVKNFKEM